MCSIFTQNSLQMHSTFTQNVLTICLKFTQTSRKIHTAFTQYLLNIHSKFTQNLLKTQHSLTSSPCFWKSHGHVLSIELTFLLYYFVWKHHAWSLYALKIQTLLKNLIKQCATLLNISNFETKRVDFPYNIKSSATQRQLRET